MIVAQVTDLHLGSEDDPVCAGNLARFERCIATLTGSLRPPDCYVVTGDIAERGDRASYETFFAIMRRVERPWFCVPGNHDDDATFRAVAAVEPAGWYDAGDTMRVGGWRIVGIDTAHGGQQGGWFDEMRAARLETMLAAEPEVPTIVAMHHPPVAIAIDWIDPDPAAAWIARFGDVVGRHPQVSQIVCGHVHMPVMARFRDIPVAIAPATAAQLWPELAPMDADRPDGRMLVVDGIPGYALHRLGTGGVATTIVSLPVGEVRLRHGVVG